MDEINKDKVIDVTEDFRAYLSGRAVKWHKEIIGGKECTVIDEIDPDSVSINLNKEIKHG